MLLNCLAYHPKVHHLFWEVLLPLELASKELGESLELGWGWDSVSPRVPFVEDLGSRRSGGVHPLGH